MELQSLEGQLSNNPYPGRGIIIGKSKDGLFAVMAYFIPVEYLWLTIGS